MATFDTLSLIIVPDEDDWEAVKVDFLGSTTVTQATRQIALTQWNGLIKNPEAYGLCFPTDEEREHMKRKQLKKKLKVGAFRDETEWLDENHPLSFYKLQNEVLPLSLASCSTSSLFSHFPPIFSHFNSRHSYCFSSAGSLVSR